MSLENPDLTLELSSARMRLMVERAMERILDHLESLPSQPAADVGGSEELARSVIEGLPRRGTPYEELLELLFTRLIPKSFNTTGPGYLAYIPGGGIFHAAVADLIAGATNRYVGVWQAAPGLAQLETNVLRWFCDMVGYPAQALGILTSGGSLANLTAIVTARINRLPENFLSGAIYTSDQAHHSVDRAARLAGFPAANLRTIPSDADFRIRLDLLQQTVATDRRAGRSPFLLVANAGTTNTGAVDDLEALGDLAFREELWLHVDAAYGGFFILTKKGGRRLAGLERADSIVLDPHKGLFLPYGTGCLLVRDRSTLLKAHQAPASYLPPLQRDPDFVDFCELSPELSRDFRGLRLWLPLKMHGIEPFRRNLEEKLALAEWAARELERIPGIELVAPPQLSLLAFRLKPGGLPRASLNDLNRRFLEEVNRRNRVHVTPALVRGDYLVRICVLSFRTHLERMRQGMEDIREAAALMQRAVQPS